LLKLIQRKSLANDQYPKTIADFNNVLINRSFDVVTNKKKAKRSQQVQNVKGNQHASNKDNDNNEIQNLISIKCKGNFIVADKEVINLLNVINRRDPKKNGL